jgi:polyhydroxyalkanoate synthesis repressor PhaR
MLQHLPPGGGATGAMGMVEFAEPVTIKQYANQRLYHTGEARYVTLADLAGMVEDDEDFVVYDAGTGEDITRAVLKKIIIGRGTHG